MRLISVSLEEIIPGLSGIISLAVAVTLSVSALTVGRCVGSPSVLLSGVEA